MIRKDVKGQYTVSHEAIEYFKIKKGFRLLAHFSFTQKKGLALLANNKFHDAIQCFDDCLALKPKPGSIPWQSPYSYTFFIYVNQKKYIEAYETIALIMNHKAFNKVKSEFKDLWYLKEAYIHFLMKMGHLDKTLIKGKPLRKFKFGRFLNDVHNFSRDKKGINITINLIKLLFYVLENKLEQVMDSLAALNQYSFRNLRDPKYIRARTFIAMLMRLPDCIYDAKKLRLKTKSNYTKLKAHPMEYTDQNINLEIIPYEQIWQELLSLFESNKA